MSNTEQKLPRMTVNEMFALDALAERAKCLHGIRSPMGRTPDVADLALALRELDDVTLQWAVKKYFAKAKPFKGVDSDSI